MKTTYRDLIRNVDLRIRANEISEARQLLLKVSPSKVPRAHQASVASLARRLNLPDFSLKTLQRTVRGDLSGVEPPKAEEKAEYGIALLRMGSQSEALNLLNEIDENEYSLTSLFRAFCYFNQWDYASAIPHLDFYLRQNAPENYQHWVAKINLLAAHIHTGNYFVAQNLIDELKDVVEARSYRYLSLSLFELEVQLLMVQEKIDEAHRRLQIYLTQRQKQGNSLTDQYLRKWQAVIIDLKKGTTENIEHLKKDPLISHSEIHRDLDFYKMQISKDHNLAHRLYVGSPYASFRKRIRDILPGFSPQPYYLVGSHLSIVSNASVIIDPFRFSINEIGESTNSVTPNLRRLLKTLFSDFYRPLLIGQIFSSLFSNEFFNPYSSPNKVHQLVHRLRSYAQSAEWSLNVENVNGGYRANMDTSNVAIRCEADLESVDLQVAKFESFRGQRGDASSFTAKDLQGWQGGSRSKTLNLLRQWKEKGWVESFGCSSRTEYFFVTNKLLPTAI